MEETDNPKGLRSGRQELLAQLRDSMPEADGYLRHNPDDADVREARERLSELDQSE